MAEIARNRTVRRNSPSFGFSSQTEEPQEIQAPPPLVTFLINIRLHAFLFGLIITFLVWGIVNK